MLNMKRASTCFDAGSGVRYCVRIERLKVDDLAHHHPQGLTVKLKLTVFGKLIHGAREPAEGTEAVACVHFDERLRPADDLTRQILAGQRKPITNRDDLNTLLGLLGEVSFERPNQHTGYQAVSKWTPSIAHVSVPIVAPPFLFRETGGYFQICYTVQEHAEYGKMRKTVGLQYYARILMAGGRKVNDVDLVRAAGKRPTPPARPRTKFDTIDGMQIGFGKQEITDAAAKTAYRVRLGQLKDEIDKARHTHDCAMVERLQREFHEIIEICDLDSDASADEMRDSQSFQEDNPSEQLRKSVVKALADAREALQANGFPEFARHLKDHVRGRRYSPPEPGPAWQF